MSMPELFEKASTVERCVESRSSRIQGAPAERCAEFLIQFCFTEISLRSERSSRMKLPSKRRIVISSAPPKVFEIKTASMMRSVLGCASSSLTLSKEV